MIFGPIYGIRGFTSLLLYIFRITDDARLFPSLYICTCTSDIECTVKPVYKETRFSFVVVVVAMTIKTIKTVPVSIIEIILT